MTVIVATQDGHRPGAMTHVGDYGDLVTLTIYDVHGIVGGAGQVESVTIGRGGGRLKDDVRPQLQPFYLPHLSHVVDVHGTFPATDGVGLATITGEIDARHTRSEEHTSELQS